MNKGETILKSEKTGNEVIVVIDEKSVIHAKIVCPMGTSVDSIVGDVSTDTYDPEKVEEMKKYIDVPSLYKL